MMMMIMMIRALDHRILGPKFGPISNAIKAFFPIPEKKSQFDRFFLDFFGSPSLFHIIQIQNILLHIYNFTE